MQDSLVTATGSVKAVDGDTVHRICSGQVIVSLSSAVKELVENSLDAEAKNIEIRLSEFGTEFVEVSDDGRGVDEQDFESLARKHHTSKLSDFNDLCNVGTFGFRGEALNSLCALSRVKIVTRHRIAKLATELTFDSYGNIQTRRVVARDVGTTVTLHDLFHSVPVRKKEFNRNCKKEFNKMVQLMQAYCLVSKGVRITCYNFSNKSRRLIFQTSGNDSVRENIVDVFGEKALRGLQTVAVVRPTAHELAAFGLSGHEPTDGCNFECLISSGVHGEGRSSNDRQFFFVNSRPWEASRVSRLVNEVYHEYNRHQYPFVFMNLEFPKHEVDVNVTPDKRKLLLDKESILLVTLKVSLKALFDHVVSEVDMDQTKKNDVTNSSQEKDRNLSTNPDPLCEGAGSVSLADLQRYRIESPGSSNAKKRKIGNSSDSASERDQPSMKDFVKRTPIEAEKTAIVAVSTSPPRNKALTDGEEMIQGEPQILVDASSESRKNHSTRVISFSMSKLKSHLASRDQPQARERLGRRFLARILPDENCEAEKELARNIGKSDFLEMEIVGQFNLGFIVVRLREDLFLVDQHATDEKFNFERLEKGQILEQQPLVVPQRLQLSATNESMLMDNLDVFVKNGFDFNITDDPATGGKRIELKTIPRYRNWSFGKADIEELLFMLADAPPGMRMCRPSRVRDMLASRACRTSIMIGKALSRTVMRRLVDHMSEMDHPWHCPHGRPTMRHLFNLNMGVVEERYEHSPS